MNEKNILFKLTANLSFQKKDKSSPKISLKPPPVAAEPGILSDADIEATASQVSAKKQKAKIEQDSSDSGGEAITILNGVTQISKKARKKKKSAVKVKNLKQIERERVSDFDSSIISSSFTLLYIIFLSLDQPHSKLEQYKCKRERCPRSDRRLCPVKDQDHVG